MTKITYKFNLLKSLRLKDYRFDLFRLSEKIQDYYQRVNMKKKFIYNILLQPLSDFEDGDIVVPIDFIINTDKCKNKLIYAGSNFPLKVTETMDIGGSVNKLIPFHASKEDSISASLSFLVDHPEINSPAWSSIRNTLFHSMVSCSGQYHLFAKIGEMKESHNNPTHFEYKSHFYIYNGKKYKGMKLLNGKMVYYRIDGDFPFIHITFGHEI